MASSVFVTGASGFLGRCLLARLSATGEQRIVCLSRRKSVGKPCGNIEFVQGDLLDRNSYAGAVAGCDMVVHLAAATGKHTPTEYFRVNRDGTKVLVSEAQRATVQHFLHISTIAVKFRDSSRYYYAQSKQQAEAVVVQSGLHWTIVRPTIILGKNAPALKALSRLATLPIVPVFGNGHVPVQPIFVDDLADCLTAMLGCELFGGRIIEIGGPDVLSIEDLLLRLRRAQRGGGAPVIHLSARPVAALLGWLEPFFRPLLPVTAGQLASFTNAGTIDPDPWVTERQKRMKRVDEILHLVADEDRPA